MKQQFSSLDIKVLSHELSQSLNGLRLQNVYDLSSRIFLFKFQKPEHREQLIVDPGFRCHLTSFVRTTAAEPSPFVRKVRKILGTRRVSAVSQLGTDRIIELQFSDGLYRLFLEFFAAGNIVVTDQEYNVLALLRNVNEASGAEQLRLGSKYDIAAVKNHDGFPETTLDRIRSGLEDVVAKSKSEQTDATVTKAKSKRRQNVTLRRALASSLSEYPLPLVDHALRLHQLDGSVAPSSILDKTDELERLLEALTEARKIVNEITSGKTKGYIFAKQRQLPKSTVEDVVDAELKDDQESGLVYEEFQPFKPKQFEDDPKLTCIEVESFNKTADKYFSSIEGQKLDMRLQERELNAKKKLEETRRQHQQRLGSLEEAQLLNIRKAEAIQANIERVVEVTAAVNGLISQGMDWVDINNLIEVEKSRGNPVAQFVKLPLKLSENTVTLLLGEPEAIDDGSETNTSVDGSASSESESETAAPSRTRFDKRLAVDVDLSLSPWANASQYYGQKRAAADKKERTALASSAALKSAQRKIEADLKKNLSKEKDILRPLRQPYWFEKFYFFLSSDGHLVLAAKDAQQADLLYSRYFQKGDVFVHADINGSSAVVIKNHSETIESPIPPSTLSQAGILAVATSTAWDSKAVMAAFWVAFEQVTKVNPNGDFLAPGDFHIKGERNFLPPAQLLVGLAIAFEISEESKALHNKHRVRDGPVDESLSSAMDSVNIGEPDERQDDHVTEPEAAGADSDEDFPDAVPQAKYESDDEDFPDAEITIDSASEDEEQRPITNPLQSANTQAADKSDTSDESDADLQSTVTESQTETTSSHRHLSAKARRLLKKGIQPSSRRPLGSADPSTPEAQDQDDSLSDTESIATTTTARGTNSHPLPRGKRTKLKKAAAKYAHQDEDDRRAAMQKVGSKPGPEQKRDDAAARLAREQEALRQKQRRREQHLLKQAVGRAQDAARHATAATAPGSEGQDGGGGGEEENAASLDLSTPTRLVGTLRPGDVVLAAVPVCAPWPALARYKYRVKLQPGAVKKGKAAREVLARWQADGKVARNVDARGEDGERMWPREVELMAGIKETEMIAVVPVGKVRVMMAGGAAKAGASQGKGKGGKPSGRGGRGKKK